MTPITYKLSKCADDGRRPSHRLRRDRAVREGLRNSRDANPRSVEPSTTPPLTEQTRRKSASFAEGLIDLANNDHHLATATDLTQGGALRRPALLSVLRPVRGAYYAAPRSRAQVLQAAPDHRSGDSTFAGARTGLPETSPSGSCRFRGRIPSARSPY